MADRFSLPKPKASARLAAPQAIPTSSQDLKPKISLENLSVAYCLKVCTVDEKAAFASRLYEMSRLTWQQIAQADRHGQGTETIKRASIKVPIPACITEDVSIIAFRCFGKAPMVGYRAHDTFYVVWIDRDFTLYAH